MMATLEQESRVLLCDKCLGDWSPEHRLHGQPIDAAEMLQRWREEIGR
jgi:alkylhydroperoxidase family enzyme